MSDGVQAFGAVPAASSSEPVQILPRGCHPAVGLERLSDVLTDVRPADRPLSVPADEAIAALCVGEHGDLVRLARLLLRRVEPGDAEDVVQEAYIRLFSRWPSLRDPAAAGFYLRRTVVNLARSRLRAVGRRRGRAEPQTDEPSAEAQVVRRSEAAAVRAAVERLPRRQREVVALRYLAELCESEIAAVLGVSIGTVKTHLRRGRAALEPVLEEHR